MFQVFTLVENAFQVFGTIDSITMKLSE